MYGLDEFPRHDFWEEGWQVEDYVFKYSEINTADFSTFASGKVNHESSFPNLKLVCAMEMKLCRIINELKKFWRPYQYASWSKRHFDSIIEKAKICLITTNLYTLCKIK